MSNKIISGALFDFMGWLTTRPKRIMLSSVDDASPAVDAIKDFAKMRGLSLDDARVKDWQEALAEQPAQQEPVALLELLREARDNCKASIVEEGISASRKEYRIDLEARLTAALNTSPPAQRKPLTDEEIYSVLENLQVMYNRPPTTDSRIIFARAIEAKLKDKNSD